ncbi:peptidoglycan-binding protein [Shinella sp. BYT-45]|uniref:peptidoglycan-binding protein n=1 Tax=Shinella sp. BYT-45 TaxID=3377377 RepID=UPI00397F4923
MNRAAFYASVRSRTSGIFGTSLSQAQVQGTEAILDEAETRGTPLRHLAYILATAYHETGGQMQPVKETVYASSKDRNPSDETVIKRLGTAWKAGKLGSVKTPYWRKDADGKAWFGRGLVQITHKANYSKLGLLIGVDLVKDPSKALELSTAVKILFVGMELGSFTGKALSDYIGDGRADYEGARRIINGTDKATKIAGHARAFERALVAAGYAAGQSASAKPKPSPAERAATDLYTDRTMVEIVQRRLYELGYTEVGSRRADGSFDGKIGDMTKAAILAFRNDNGLPVADVIDREMLEALDKAPKRNLPRSDAPADQVRQSVPEVKSNWLMKVGAYLVGIPAALGTFFDGILGNLGVAKSYIDPLKESFSDIPGWVWFASVLVIAGGTYLIASHGEKKGVEAFQEGARR